MSDRAADLYAALLAADTSAAILAALGAAIAHNEGRQPRVPTVADLTAWLFRGECPPTETAAADELMGDGWGWTLIIEHGIAAVRWINDGAEIANVATVHARWRALPEPRPRHPLAPLVDAWQRWKAAQPVPKRAVDTGACPNVIVPRSVAMVNEHAPSYYLQRFNGAAHRNAYGQLTLGFEHPDMDGPTLPANIWTLQLAEAEKRGHALPAALRAFLAAIVHVPLAARRVTSPTDPPVMLQTPRDEPLTLRHFLPMVYNGRKRPGEYWHVLHGVRSILHSEAADVPYEWNGRIWTRSVVRMDGIPEGAYDTAMLDEPWPVSVWLPPGDGTGPAIAWALLLRLMCNDPAAARLLINLAYRWHIEGKRLYPVGKGKKRHWLHHPDPTRYDRFTDREADLYCFPPGTGREGYAQPPDRRLGGRGAPGEGWRRGARGRPPAAPDRERRQPCRERRQPPMERRSPCMERRSPCMERRSPCTTPRFDRVERLQMAVFVISTPTSTEEGGERQRAGRLRCPPSPTKTEPEPRRRRPSAASSSRTGKRVGRPASVTQTVTNRRYRAPPPVVAPATAPLAQQQHRQAGRQAGFRNAFRNGFALRPAARRPRTAAGSTAKRVGRPEVVTHFVTIPASRPAARRTGTWPRCGPKTPQMSTFRNFWPARPCRRARAGENPALDTIICHHHGTQWSVRPGAPAPDRARIGPARVVLCPQMLAKARVSARYFAQRWPDRKRRAVPLDRNGWRMFVAGCAHTIERGKAAQRRNAETQLVEAVARWAADVDLRTIVDHGLSNPAPPLRKDGDR